jgi:hypothetical protein
MRVEGGEGIEEGACALCQFGILALLELRLQFTKLFHFHLFNELELRFLANALMCRFFVILCHLLIDYLFL